MIRSIVSYQDTVVSPIWTFFVQLCCQLVQVDLDRLVIGVCLRQCDVDIPQSVKGSDDCDPRSQRKHRLDIGGSVLSPLHPAEVALVEPALIEVDQDLALIE